MINNILAKIFIASLLTFSSIAVFSQNHPDLKKIYEVKTTSVKDQANSGTCWSYAPVSFIESELIKNGYPEVDISEMFFVRHAYIDKASYYIRLHGNANFSQGGQAHDVMNTAKRFGMVPQDVYSGLALGMFTNEHAKLEEVLKKILEVALKNSEKGPWLQWKDVFVATLDIYLGIIPESWSIKNKKITPMEYMKDEIKFNPDDYIELTSFSHHPYYTLFDLEIPDNWSHNLYYNIKPDELVQTIDYALSKGYSICWDGDVSEDGFSYRTGKAILSEHEKNLVSKDGLEFARQTTFDNFSTTDDHLMHITGLAKDNNGTKYYQTKNSWGNSNNFGGYIFLSEQYLALKTVAIMVYKKAIPETIAKNLNLK